MRKYLLQECKKNLTALAVFTLAWTALCVTHFSTVELVYEIYDWQAGALQEVQVGNPYLWVYFIPLYMLCMLTPVFIYAFKMDKRSVDYYYAFPLKKEKLYFVKTLVGLFLILAPFTVAYWAGFVTLAMRPENMLQMGWFVPIYFLCVLFAVCLYGIHAFIFTRANKVSDGVAFIFAYTFLTNVLLLYANAFMNIFDLGEVEYSIMQSVFFFGLSEFSSYATGWVRVGTAKCTAWTFVYPAIAAAAAYFLLFFLLRSDKAENAEQISESWFGYKTLIPVYTALVLGVSGFELLSMVFCAVGAVIATVCYRRKFKFSWKYWLMIGGAVALGMVLSVLVL